MPRPTQNDIPGVEGPGVSQPRFKDIDRLADKFIDIRDQKSDLASQLTKIESQIAEKMEEHGITKYSFSDQVVEMKQGNVHIKIKNVKAEGVETDSGDE